MFFINAGIRTRESAKSVSYYTQVEAMCFLAFIKGNARSKVNMYGMRQKNRQAN